MADDVFLLADTLQVGTFVMLSIVHIKKRHLMSNVDIGRDRAQITTLITKLRLVRYSDDVTTPARKLRSRLIRFLRRYREMIENDSILGLRHSSQYPILASTIQAKPKPVTTPNLCSIQRYTGNVTFSPLTWSTLKLHPNRRCKFLFNPSLSSLIVAA